MAVVVVQRERLSSSSTLAAYVKRELIRTPTSAESRGHPPLPPPPHDSSKSLKSTIRTALGIHSDEFTNLRMSILEE